MKGITIIRAAYGMILLLWSDRVIHAVLDESGGSAGQAATVGRILGARHLLQALTIERTNSRGWLFFGAAIDTIHVLSMGGIAVLDEEHRRLAASDAILASGLTLYEMYCRL
jgi:hypothetical protein